MNRIFFILLILLLTACSSTNQAVRLTNPANKPKNISSKIVKIPLDLYKETVSLGGVKNRARMVEVFSRGGNDFPRYRFFDIKRGSVLDLMEIKNSDILITANGYVVPDQDAFWKYLNVLHLQEEAFIEVSRGGAPLLLEYKFKQ